MAAAALGLAMTLALALGGSFSAADLGTSERVELWQGHVGLTCDERRSLLRTERFVAHSGSAVPDLIAGEPVQFSPDGPCGVELPGLARQAMRESGLFTEGAWRGTALTGRMVAGGWGGIPADNGQVESIAVGWPLRCFWGSFDWQREGCFADSSSVGLYDTGRTLGRRRRLLIPCLPLWPNLLLNTLLFAAPLWAMLVGVRAVRQRHRRGCCAGCGYDLVGLPRTDAQGLRCPECGQGA